MEEIWKDIEGFEGYRISNLGNFMSCRRGSKAGSFFGEYRPIKPASNSDKRSVIISFRVDGKQKSFLVGRLVYKNFVGPIPEGMQIDHKDRNIWNNCLSNLRLATPSQNNMNARKKSSKYKGLSKQGNKWQVRVVINNKRTYLGLFDTPEKAALVYNEYAREHYKEFACLNEVK